MLKLWALALKGCPLKRGGGGIKKKNCSKSTFKKEKAKRNQKNKILKRRFKMAE